jgi:hypothetical protein
MLREGAAMAIAALKGISKKHLVSALAKSILVPLLLVFAALLGAAAGMAETGSARIVCIISLVFLGGLGLIFLIRDFWKSPSR